MSLDKKLVTVFLTVINIINIFSGIITLVKLFKPDSVVTSILPITAQLSARQILMINFMSVSVIILLINAVTLYLAADCKYTPAEIIKNCPGTFLIIPAVIALGGIIAVTGAQTAADGVLTAVCSVAYFACCAVGAGCIETLIDDCRAE